MRKFYVLNIKQGSEDPRNIKKVISDPKSQGGEDMWPLDLSEALGLQEVRPGGHALKLKLFLYLLLKRHMMCIHFCSFTFSKMILLSFYNQEKNPQTLFL